MPSLVSSLRRDWLRRMQHAIVQYWYITVVLAIVVAGVLAEVIRTEKGWPLVAALLLFLAGLAVNLLASVIHDRRHRRLPPAEARGCYLQGLIKHCQALPLAALGGEEGIDHGPTLDQVYIALDTTTQVPREAFQLPQPGHAPRTVGERTTETQPLSAEQALRQTPYLALLGNPGSGKSTFVRLMLCSVARAQHDTTMTPRAGLPRDLWPILITLRDLAPRLASLEVQRLPDYGRRQLLADAVLEQTVDDLHRWTAEDFTEGLREVWQTGRCLLVLDGLDEVPPDLRRRVREAVGAVLETYHVQRVIVTCRVRSYGGEVKLPGFQDYTLADFDDDKVQAFAQAWYNTQHTLGRVDTVQAQQKAADLMRAALTDDLRELAANPMLLTTMAIIHQRDTRLPRERVRLYHQAVEVLLRRWQQGKVGEAGLTPEPALAEVLSDDQRLRTVIEGLAYHIHCEQQAGRATDGLSRRAAITFLDHPDYLGRGLLPQAFLDYVDKQAGLLVGKGDELDRPGTYDFPHRTFQEYLVGCYLVKQREKVRLLFTHAGQEDFWSLAVQFGAEELCYNRPVHHELLDLAYDLCPTHELLTIQARRGALWSGTMAALLGRDRIVRDTGRPAGGAAYLERIQSCLVSLLGSELTPSERAEAGNALAQLGDPRFLDEDTWYLLKDATLGFIDIPAGSFRMGSAPEDEDAFDDEKEQHDVHLPRYYIARFPVTVAQFRAFVDKTGHPWEDEGYPQGPSNHPVVSVNWHDAVAYCEWLTGCLREWQNTPAPLAALLRDKGWCVTLPSEAQWEKAARGMDGRRYPWGNDPDPQRANYAETGIGTTSAVGCFPTGKSLYGVEDLSGNVWEWTRSLWGEDLSRPTFTYPYKPDDGRENLQAPDAMYRDLRGGAFWPDRRLVRCAYRFRDLARHSLNGVGCRVVLAARP